MNTSSTSPTVEQWLACLQDKGFRITAPMRVVVSLLANSPRALGPMELFELGRQAYPRLGLVTVYRTLDKLEDLELVQRVHQANGCHAYLRAAQGHQHILICRRCGLVQYFSGDDLSELIAATAKHSGFAIEEHWLQLQGLCAACQS